MAEGLPLRLVAKGKVPWREDGGRAVLLAPRFSPGFFGRIMRRLFGDLTVRLKLDDLGSRVWKACDGSTTLEQIADSLGEEPRARERVELFLRELHRNGWVELLVPEIGGEDKEPE